MNLFTFEDWNTHEKDRVKCHPECTDPLSDSDVSGSWISQPILLTRLMTGSMLRAWSEVGCIEAMVSCRLSPRAPLVSMFLAAASLSMFPEILFEKEFFTFLRKVA